MKTLLDRVVRGSMLPWFFLAAALTLVTGHDGSVLWATAFAFLAGATLSAHLLDKPFRDVCEAFDRMSKLNHQLLENNQQLHDASMELVDASSALLNKPSSGGPEAG